MHCVSTSGHWSTFYSDPARESAVLSIGSSRCIGSVEDASSGSDGACLTCMRPARSDGMSGRAHPSYRRARTIALRALTLSVLAFALPTTKQVVENTLALASAFADDCGDTSATSDCDDDCGEKSSSVPKPCQHCSCCAPRSVVPPLVVAPAAAAVVATLERVVPTHVHAPGFRAPPFRPPAA